MVHNGDRSNLVFITFERQKTNHDIFGGYLTQAHVFVIY